MSYAMLHLYRVSAPRLVLRTELCMLPWETAFPIPKPTLLLHRWTACPRNPDKRHCLNGIMMDLNEPTRRLSQPAKSNLVNPTLHLRHPNPIKKRPRHHPNLSKILPPVLSLHTRQYLHTHHLIMQAPSVQPPMKERSRKRSLNSVEQCIHLPRAVREGQLRRVQHLTTQEMGRCQPRG